jgi:TRAP transporter 4TM/12TM fusion protein
MEKHPKSKFRLKEFTYYLMAVAGLVHIIMLRFIPTTPQFKAILFLLYTLVFIFLVKRSKYFIIDLIFVVMSVIPTVYLLTNYTTIVMRAGSPPIHEWFFAFSVTIALLEATRRTTGYPLVVISVIFLLYGFLGQVMPGLLWHRGFSLSRFTQNMFITTGGIFSSPMQTASTIIVAFIIMGELMVNLGAGDFFTRSAEKLTGNLTAGNAKMSIIAGLLFGMINGSAAANVVTTGQITIPLMKKEGYSSEYAGAIAAAAATGGPLSPPVMGAGAFLLAEFCGISYGEVCLLAITPAIFYYLAIFLCVHFEAKRLDIKKNLPVNPETKGQSAVSMNGKKRPLLAIEYYHILVPLVVLVVLIVLAFPVLFACIISMALMLIMGFVNPYCKMTVKTILDTLSNGIKGSLGVTAACACSGIIVCVIGSTGLGLTFTSFVLQEGISLMLALFLTMIILIILGMGLPGIAAYIVGASVAVSVLRRFGIPDITAHLFIYYFSCLAVLTPPVALTAYAAAGISGGNPVKTGYKSVLIASAGFIAPYVFVLDPALILQGEITQIIFRIFLTGVGVFGLAIGITGFLKYPIGVLNRSVFIVGGLCAIYPTRIADILGLGLVVIGIAINILVRPKGQEISGI